MHLCPKVLTYLLLLSPLLSQTVDLNTFEIGTADSTASTTRTVLLDSDPAGSQHGLRVETRINGLTSNVFYRIGYLLLNREGDAVDIAFEDSNGAPISVSMTQNSSSGTYRFAPESTATLGQLSKTLFLTFPDNLSVNDYEVRVALFSFSGTKWIEEKLQNISTRSAYFEMRSFSVAKDSQYNVKLRLDTITLDRPIIINGASGFESFPVSLDLRAFRYDSDDTGSRNIAASVRADFIEADGTVVPAILSQDDSSFSSSSSVTLSSISSKFINPITFSSSPSVKSFAQDFYLRPASSLVTAKEVTSIRFSASHFDNVTFPLITVHAADTAISEQLFISDGNLLSGTASAQIEGLTSISGSVVLNNTITLALTGLQGSLDTGHSFNGNANISIDSDNSRLESTLLLSAPNSPDETQINGVTMRRGVTALTSVGPAMSSGEVKLPRGLGWVAVDSDYGYASNVCESWLKILGTNPSGTIPLDGSLEPSESTLVLQHPSSTPASPIALALNEESKPFVWVAASLDWLPASGSITWDAQDVIACHNDEWQILEAAIANGGENTWGWKRDNRSYLRQLQIPASTTTALDPGEVVVKAGIRGDARVNTEIQINYPGSGATFTLYPHSPMGANLFLDNSNNTAGGHLVISDDRMNGELRGISSIMQGYHSSGIEDTCQAGGFHIISTLLPEGNQVMRITTDGGLLSPALKFNPNLPVNPLKIGSTVDTTGNPAAVHAISGWSNNSIDFLVAGISLAGANGWHNVNSQKQQGVSILLNSGFGEAEDSSLVAERPGSDAYTAGTASYPGLNFRVDASETPITGVTYLGDSRIPSNGSYNLRTNSKYYARLGGVNGAHDIDFTSHSGIYLVYGYELDFQRFGLAYLNNLNAEYGLDSTVAANLQFSAAPLNNFALAFDTMSVTGGGDLQSGELVLDAENPKEPLAYWGGAALPRSFNFNPKAADPCDKVRLLVLGVETYAALIDSPLHGYLAIASNTTPGLGYSNGSLVSLTDAATFENTRPRIFLPGQVQMRGPAKTVGSTTTYEYYNIRPVADAYFNNYDAANRPNSGFIAFGATMGVSFFEDLKIHLRTPAANAPDQTTADTSTIYLSGGWDDGGNTFWNHPEDYEFDAAHKGWHGTFDTYWTQNHLNEDYDIRAEQDIFGLIEISYPVQWNPNLRQFTAAKQSVDLLVLDANHKLDFLTPERASMTFGVRAEMDGIPNINLGSIAMNATGAANGILATLRETASSAIGEVLDTGSNAVESLLKDVPEELFTQTWEMTIAPTLRGEINAGYDANQMFNDFKADLAAATNFDAAVSIGAYFDPDDPKWFYAAVNQAMESVDDADSLIRQVDGKLAQLQNGIRSVTSVSIDQLNPAALWGGEFQSTKLNGSTVTIKWNDLKDAAINDYLE